MKGKSRTGRKEARKKAVKLANLKDFVKEVREYEREEQPVDQPKALQSKFNVFDRFKKKKN